MSDTVVDTCCLVSLCVAVDPARLLPTIPWTWHVPVAVANEGMYVPETEDGGRAAKRRIMLEPYFNTKVLNLCDAIGPDEASLYVELARQLDDGEAMGLAIAKQRGWTFATDDRKGRRKAAELDVKVLTTPQVMRAWVEVNAISTADAADALFRIQTLARFIPAVDSPEFAWWNQTLSARPNPS